MVAWISIRRENRDYPCENACFEIDLFDEAGKNVEENGWDISGKSQVGRGKRIGQERGDRYGSLQAKTDSYPNRTG